MTVIAFRTEGPLEQRLRRIAAREKKTRTAVITEALEVHLAGRERMKSSTRPAGGSLADVLKRDIGVWSGPPDASVNTGRQLGDILVAKRGTRRL